MQRTRTTESYRVVYRAGSRLLLLAAVIGLVSSVGSPGWARGRGGAEAIPLAEADLFFELNNSDGDLGIHANIDGEPWERLVVEAPNRRKMLNIRVRSKLREQGLTQLSFESAEPHFDDLAPEEFFERFPEGVYRIEARGLERQRFESQAEITHLLPAPASGIRASGTPILPEEIDCDAGPLPLVREPVLISWDPVTRSHPELGRTNEPIEVVRYQLVVERDDFVYSVELSPDVTELEVPPSFTALADDFKLEILVKEESGNQTAIESCFQLDR